MKLKLILLLFLIGLTRHSFSQRPTEERLPTMMGTYLILHKPERNFFTASNLDQGVIPEMTQMQWALADAQKINVLNMPQISHNIFTTYFPKPNTIYASVLINNQGKAIFVRFIVKNNHYGNNIKSVAMTADKLAEIEDMIKKYKFTFTGNVYNLPYFPYGFYINSHNLQ